MAKRFTDSDKWADPWFMGLDPKMKLVWLAVCDLCDGAGVWKVNLPLLSFYVGGQVTLDDLRSTLDRRSIWLRDDKLWLTGFIKFQYKSLSKKNSAHLGIMKKVVELSKGIPLTGEVFVLVERFKTLIRESSEGHLTLNSGSIDPVGEGEGRGEGNGKGRGRGEGKERGGVGEIYQQEVSPDEVKRILADSGFRSKL